MRNSVVFGLVLLASVHAQAQSLDREASCKRKFPEPALPQPVGLTPEESQYLAQGIGTGFRTSQERARISALFSRLEIKLAKARDTLAAIAEARRARANRTAASQNVEIGPGIDGEIWFARSSERGALSHCLDLKYAAGFSEQRRKEIWDACGSSLKAESLKASLNPSTWTSVKSTELALAYARGLEAYFSNCGIPELKSSDPDCRDEKSRTRKLELAGLLAKKAQEKYDEFTEKLQCELISYNDSEKALEDLEAHLKFIEKWNSDPKKLFPAETVEYKYERNTKKEDGDPECAKKFTYPVIPPLPKYSGDELRFLTLAGFTEYEGDSVKYLAPIDDKYRTSQEYGDLAALVRALEPKLRRASGPLDALFEQRLAEARREATRLGFELKDDLKLPDANLLDTSSFSVSSVEELTPQRWAAFKAAIANLEATVSLNPKTWTTPAIARQAWQLALLRNHYYEVCGHAKLNEADPDCKNGVTREAKRKNMEEAQLAANDTANRQSLKLQCDLEYLNRVNRLRETINTNLQIVDVTKQKLPGGAGAQGAGSR
ncbi:MAG TPA: hypothetical protein VFV50_04545 [Bdellovibrionales bacterium]|nr:hypothetical protein [Bdellovibrionales bacterium]